MREILPQTRCGDLPTSTVKINIHYEPNSMVLPDRCSMAKDSKQCPNPPEFIVSIVTDDGEYMVGVTCGRHRQAISIKIKTLQDQTKIRDGMINFSPVKSVGTDCLTDCDDAGSMDRQGWQDSLIQIGRNE